MRSVVAQLARILVLTLAVALLVSPASRFGFLCADVAMANASSSDAPTRDCCTPDAACATLCQAVPAAVQLALDQPAPLDAVFTPAIVFGHLGVDAELTPPPPRLNAV